MQLNEKTFVREIISGAYYRYLMISLVVVAAITVLIMICVDAPLQETKALIEKDYRPNYDPTSIDIEYIDYNDPYTKLWVKKHNLQFLKWVILSPSWIYLAFVVFSFGCVRYMLRKPESNTTRAFKEHGIFHACAAYLFRFLN
jgi:predicted membrane channel-forming protein YqfA (hemolysin III family)